MALAPVAGATVDHHVGRHPVAGFERGDAAPDLHDLAGELVPHDDRSHAPGQRVRAINLDEERPVAVLLQVGAADAAGANLQDHLARTRRTRFGRLLDPDVVASVPHRCLHVVPSSRCSHPNLDQMISSPLIVWATPTGGNGSDLGTRPLTNHQFGFNMKMPGT
jgi:hypothetical protein